MSPLRGRNRIRVFLLGIAGTYIKLSGAIYLDGVISTILIGDELMPRLPFIPLDKESASHYDQHVLQTAHTLCALRECLDELKREYASMKEGDLRVFKTPTGTLPAPHFRNFTSSTGIKYELEYLSHLLDTPHDSRSLFVAEATSDSMGSIKCVVKFTERYGKAAHEIMEKMNMAAELLYCSREASVGLFVVITRFYESDSTAPLSDEILQQLDDGLKRLHGNNLVHGDLRRPNILIDEEGRVRLIDFEWSGEAGVVRYHVLLNLEILWPEGVEPGGRIQPQHDLDNLALYKKQRDADTT